jgi:predicted transcriptional regulator
MKPPPTLPGGDLERAVLAAVWALGRASAREVHDSVGAPSGLVYTTIAKVLDRLHDKGLVKRELEGRAFVYRARIRRKDVEAASARKALSRILAPTPGPAIATLVDAVESVDPALLDELARVVDARRRARRGS